MHCRLIHDCQKSLTVPELKWNHCSHTLLRSSYDIAGAVEPLLTPFLSTITPSSVYLGMPKPCVYVRLPLDLALDAWVTGSAARFVRSGGWPNASPTGRRTPRSKPLYLHQQRTSDTITITITIAMPRCKTQVWTLRLQARAPCATRRLAALATGQAHRTMDFV